MCQIVLFLKTLNDFEGQFNCLNFSWIEMNISENIAFVHYDMFIS